MSDHAEWMLVQGNAARLPLADASVDLVFGSPPYLSARLYLEGGRDLGIARGLDDWIAWMILVTAECLRVSRGAVVWVAAGSTKGRNYLPACEGLMAAWKGRRVGSGVWEDGIELPGEAGSMYRPCYWHRVGIPGSGGDQWFRADVEYAMCFKRPGPLPWADNTALGHAPKFKPGGVPSHRLPSGTRANLVRAAAAGKTLVRVSRRKSGQDFREADEFYIPPEIANPGNLVSTGAAGGGNTGPAEALAGNEAPFPEALAEFFVRSLCPPGGLALDPFSGSGTTCAAAVKHGRRAVGLDLRRSQCRLGARRIAAGLRPASRLDPPKSPPPLAGQMSFLAEPSR